MKTLSITRFTRAVAVLLSLSTLTVAVHAGGKVAAWGDNSYGQCVLPNGLKGIKAIAGGESHCLALRADGRVVAWGYNGHGRTSVPEGLTNVRAVAAGAAHSLALKTDGTIAGWGLDNYGQATGAFSFSGVTAITAGGYHSLALKADGTVVAWGYNAFGQTNIPTGLSNVIAVAAGGYHNLAVKGDGTVIAWGLNTSGQTNVPPGLSNVIAVAAGGQHSLALKGDGQIIGWGGNYYGEASPPAGISNFTAMAGGYFHTTALKADGTVAVWGRNDYGQTNVPPGLANVTGIAAAGYFSLALVAEGPIQILDGPSHQGVAYTSNATFSVIASGAAPMAYHWFFNGSALADSPRISGTTTDSLTIANAQFSDMGTYTVVVSNAFGSVLSTGAVLTVISPPIITLQPAGRTVIAGTNITLTATATGTPPLSYQWLLEGTPLAGATLTSLSLSSIQSSQSGNYSLRVTNLYGPTDSSNALVTVLESAPYILNQPTNRSAFLGGIATFTVNARGSTPIHFQWRFNGSDIPGATNTSLALASLRFDQAGFYTVAISNAFGVTISAKAELTVEQVAIWAEKFRGRTFTTNVPPGLTNAVAIAACDSRALALKADGTITNWLVVSSGSTAVSNAPPGLTNISAIAIGAVHNLVLRSNGTVVAWRDAGTIFPPYQNIAAITNVPAGLSNVIAIAAGDYHSLALKADRTVVSWGLYSSTNVPAGLSNVVAIAAGGGQNLALKQDGKVLAWGNATNVPASLTNIIAVACADGYGLALRSNGKVTAWPVSVGGIPHGGLAVTNVPNGLSNVVAISAGLSEGMALQANGNVVQWGSLLAIPPAGLSNVFAISAGSDFLAALIGDGAPRFTIQPASQTVSNGAKVEFHARAVGVQPLAYQWQLDGINLPGATNADLTITNAHGNDTGSYQVKASNARGGVLSAPASLAIPFSTNLAAALNPNLVWTTGATNAPWFAQIRESHDGGTAAQSGRISHGQQSILQTTVTGPGTLTFWWKVSSEEGYDRLLLYVDVMSSVRVISGETDWRQVTMPIPSGPHVVLWSYAKDATVSAGQDAGWVDEVAFTPAAPLTLGAPRLLPDGSLAFSSTDASGQPLLPENLPFIEFQASTNLRDWITLTGGCTLTNGTLILRDPDCVNLPSRFYRTVVR